MNYRHINSVAGHDQQPRRCHSGPRADRQPAVHALDDVRVAAFHLRRHIVNEARYGGTGGSTLFSPEIAASMFSNTGNALAEHVGRAAAPGSS